MAAAIQRMSDAPADSGLIVDVIHFTRIPCCFDCGVKFTHRPFLLRVTRPEDIANAIKGNYDWVCTTCLLEGGIPQGAEFMLCIKDKAPPSSDFARAKYMELERIGTRTCSSVFHRGFMKAGVIEVSVEEDHLKGYLYPIRVQGWSCVTIGGHYDSSSSNCSTLHLTDGRVVHSGGPIGASGTRCHPTRWISPYTEPPSLEREPGKREPPGKISILSQLVHEAEVAGRSAGRSEVCKDGDLALNKKKVAYVVGQVGLPILNKAADGAGPAEREIQAMIEYPLQDNQAAHYHNFEIRDWIELQDREERERAEEREAHITQLRMELEIVWDAAVVLSSDEEEFEGTDMQLEGSELNTPASSPANSFL